MSREVAITRDDPVLSMHDPRILPSLHGMEVVSIDDVPESAVKCSACFDEQDSCLYDFPYTDDGII